MSKTILVNRAYYVKVIEKALGSFRETNKPFQDRNNYAYLLYDMVKNESFAGLVEIFSTAPNHGFLRFLLGIGTKSTLDLYKFLRVTQGAQAWLRSKDVGSHCIKNHSYEESLLLFATATKNSESLEFIKSYSQEDIGEVNERNWRSERSYALKEIVVGVLSPESFDLDEIKRIKRFDMERRKSMFRGVTASGLVDEKIARRMRSDSSEEVSLYALRDLIFFGHKYENLTDLLDQFNDTKHFDVLKALSRYYSSEEAIGLMGSSIAKNYFQLEQVLSSVNINNESSLFSNLNYETYDFGAIV